MQKISIFQQIFLSCSSFDFYADIYKNNFKHTLKFILAFFLMAGFLNAVTQFFLIKQEAEKLQVWAQKTTPSFSEGILKLKTPDIFKAKNENFIFIIDVDNESQIIPETYPVGIMITKDHMILKNQDKHVKTPLPKEENDIIFDEKTIKEYKDSFLSLLLLIVIPAGIILFILFKLLYILAFSALTLIYINLFSSLKEKLNFTKVLNICSYATIAPTIFFLVFFTLNKTTASLIYFGMYGAFIAGAISKIKTTFTDTNNLQADI